MESGLYPNTGSDHDHHVYDAKRYLKKHPEVAPKEVLFFFFPDLIQLTHKLVATLVSLSGTDSQLSMQRIESEFKRLFQQRLDPSLFHFSSQSSIVKVLIQDIAEIADIQIESNNMNYSLFMRKDGLKNWIWKKRREEGGLDVIRDVLTWSKKYLVEECDIFPPSKDCHLRERQFAPEWITESDRREIGELRWHPVVISAVSTPRAFWVNLLADRNKLNQLTDELDNFYNSLSYSPHSFPFSSTRGSSSSYDVPDFLVCPGMVVAVKFFVDQSYQRGIVTNCSDLNQICVRFVDFGGSGFFPIKELRLLNKHFVEAYPEAFGVKVAMFGIGPQMAGDPNSPILFPSEARRYLLHFSDYEKRIAAAFVTRKYLRPPKSGLTGLRAGRVLFEVFLCDVTEAGKDLYLHEELLKAGVASQVPGKYSIMILNGLKTEEEVYKKMQQKLLGHK